MEKLQNKTVFIILRYEDYDENMYDELYDEDSENLYNDHKEDYIPPSQPFSIVGVCKDKETANEYINSFKHSSYMWAREYTLM